jgi:hypothetical protein
MSRCGMKQGMADNRSHFMNLVDLLDILVS